MIKTELHDVGTKNTGGQLELIHDQKDTRETWLHATMRAKTDELIKPYLDEFRKIWGVFPEPVHQSEIKVTKYTKTTIGEEHKEIKEFDILADEVYILKSSRATKYIIFECETKSVTSNLPISTSI